MICLKITSSVRFEPTLPNLRKDHDRDMTVHCAGLGSEGDSVMHLLSIATSSAWLPCFFAPFHVCCTKYVCIVKDKASLEKDKT